MARAQSIEILTEWEMKRREQFEKWQNDFASPLIQASISSIHQGKKKNQTLCFFFTQRVAAERQYAKLLVGTVGNSNQGAGPIDRDALGFLQSLQLQQANQVVEFANTVESVFVKKGLEQTSKQYDSVSQKCLDNMKIALRDCTTCVNACAEAFKVHKTLVSQQCTGRPNRKDTWLSEEKYRQAVLAMKVQQRDFTEKMIAAAVELRELENWRFDTAKKSFEGFCQKTHRQATIMAASVSQSMVNPAVMPQIVPLDECLAVEAQQSFRECAFFTSAKQMAIIPQLPESMLVEKETACERPVVGLLQRWRPAKVLLTVDSWLHCIPEETTTPCWSAYVEDAVDTKEIPTTEGMVIEFQVDQKNWFGMSSQQKLSFRVRPSEGPEWFTILSSTSRGRFGIADSEASVSTRFTESKTNKIKPPPPIEDRTVSTKDKLNSSSGSNGHLSTSAPKCNDLEAKAPSQNHAPVAIAAPAHEVQAVPIRNNVAPVNGVPAKDEEIHVTNHKDDKKSTEGVNEVEEKKKHSKISNTIWSMIGQSGEAKMPPASLDYILEDDKIQDVRQVPLKFAFSSSRSS